MCGWELRQEAVAEAVEGANCQAGNQPTAEMIGEQVERVVEQPDRGA